MPAKKFLFIIDPIEKFNPVSETTFWIMAEMTRRKHRVFGATLENLFLQNSDAITRATEYRITKASGKFSYKTLATQDQKVSNFHAVFLRKDPPVDLKFWDHLSILELARGKTLLVNDPTGVKQSNEKIFPHRFSGISPETIVASDAKILREFICKNGTVVIKPLNLSGGREIVIANKNDASLNSLLELSTNNHSRYVMAQKFLPEAKKGDKRVLILDGEILGCFLRVPGSEDFRGNLHSGAKLKAAKLSAHELKLIKSLLPAFKSLGLYFVGLDFLGDYITEINVTSPMGIGELVTLYKSNADKKFVDWAEKGNIA